MYFLRKISISKRFESFVKKCTQTMISHDLGAFDVYA